MDMNLNFNSDGTMDFDSNVKVAKQEIKCASVVISATDTAIAFPNIRKTGDCMGDALRGQKTVIQQILTFIGNDESNKEQAPS